MDFGEFGNTKMYIDGIGCVWQYISIQFNSNIHKRIYWFFFLLFDNIYKNNITAILRIYVNNEFIC